MTKGDAWRTGSRCFGRCVTGARPNSPTAGSTTAFFTAAFGSVTFAAPAWEGYTNADGSGLYWDLLKQVYAPYGLDVKFINMPWNRANKLMTAGSMVDGVPGEIPGVEGKLYAQLPIDIEYHGVMHAAKTPFSGRASLTGKRVGWRHSYNLIPAEQRDFTLVECVRPERCTEQVQNGELDFFLDEPDELEKQRSEAHLPADAYPIAQLPPGKESFMTFADSASGAGPPGHVVDRREVAIEQQLRQPAGAPSRDDAGTSTGPVAFDRRGLVDRRQRAKTALQRGSSRGVGYLILQAEGTFDINTVFAGILVLTGFALLLDAVVGVIERRLMKWQPKGGETEKV